MKPLTPRGVAGIAVVEVGPAERPALLACLRTRAGGPFVSRSRAPVLALLTVDGAPVDEVLVVDRGPKGLELHLHGAPAVLAALRGHFGAAAGPATPVEPAEALLRSALSPEQLDLALEQRAWSFADRLCFLRSLPAAERAGEVAQALERSRAAMALCNAQRVVLVGAQNAGKSTLFNHLLCRERVLTGPLPGLTRDPVVETTTLGGYPYELVDTAGVGLAATAVDAAAIAAGQALRAAAITLLLVDASRGPSAEDRRQSREASLVIATKEDLAGPAWPADVPRHLVVSCATSTAAEVRQRFGELLRSARHLPPAGRVGGFAALVPAQYEALAASVTEL